MATEARKIVDHMSDADAVRFLSDFGKSVFEETPTDVILNGIAPELQASVEVQQIEKMEPETRTMTVGPEDSARIARTILEAMADDEKMGPALVHAWEEYDSDELFVETVLAAGFVASMLLFTSTTEIEFEVKGVKFKKGAASPDLLRAIAEPLFGALQKLQGH